MKIKMVKLFQAIRIGSQTETSVQNEFPGTNYGVSGISGVTITNDERGLYFKKGDDTTFTTWANVCYATVDNEQSEPVKKAK